MKVWLALCRPGGLKYSFGGWIEVTEPLNSTLTPSVIFVNHFCWPEYLFEIELNTPPTCKGNSVHRSVDWHKLILTGSERG
jgi:hypothetical protein